MAMQTILRMSLLLTGVCVAGPVSAQTADDPRRPPPSANAQTTVRAAPAGPVLRRQPGVADVPSTAATRPNSQLDPQSTEDEVLNRMIAGICRGC